MIGYSKSLLATKSGTVSGMDDWVPEVNWNCTSTHSSNYIGPPLAPIGFSPASSPSNAAVFLGFKEGRYSSSQLFDAMDTCTPVSQKASTGTPLNSHETLNFLPTRLATATCYLGVKWLANTWQSQRSTRKRFYVSRCSIACQSLLWLLQWSFWHLCPQYRTALQPEHCLKTWSFPATLWQQTHFWYLEFSWSGLLPVPWL